MNLTSDLISQFVKVTNDKTETKKETTVFGTTVELDGVTYVKIDGSDRLTPVNTTAATKPGERVTVMIKNHTATVTGNISSPAARSEDVDNLVLDAEAIGKKITEFEIAIGDKVDVEELNAANARIDTLYSDNATIKENLTANNADIDNLQAANVTITEQLNADKANIETLQTTKLDAEIAEAKYATIEKLEATNADLNNLEATYGDFVILSTSKFEALEADIAKLEAGEISVEQLKATFATIVQLEAEQARITKLEAELAEVDTLIFGSATGSTIQTSFANAVIAQLGDAQIKSAMIKDVSASKITSGDIITNNVRVLSEDGKLLISDETIQISDDTRVRVQIGKDASNDYSINIWDANGNLMFSEGGITDSAIKEAIIRNDMVSDTANIAAHKLDIDSLFEEINGSSNTIKSTQVYLDDQKQALNVAFKELSTEVTEQGETISSQGTQITTIQGQINSKIWQEDINTASNSMATQYSTLSQKLDNFQTTVGQTYATKDDIGDISVGGRNLFGFNKGVIFYDLGNSEYAKGSFNEDIRGFQTSVVTDSPAQMIITRLAKLGFNGEAGESYTFSAKVYANVDDVKISLDICDRGNIAYIIGTTAQKISFTVVPLDYYYSASYNGFFDVVVSNNHTVPAGTIIYFEDVKIERGNVATDWTPAPEDLAGYSEIKSMETRITQTESSITSLASRTTVVEDKFGDYSTTNQMNSAIKQTANNITASIETVRQSVDNVSVGGRNLLLGTSVPYVVNEREEFEMVSTQKVYYFNDEILTDVKAFLLDVENNYLLLSYDVDLPAIYKNNEETLNRVGCYFSVTFTEIETGTRTHWYGTHSSAIMGQGNTLAEGHNGTSNSLINVTGTSDSPTSFIGHYCGYCDMSTNSGSTIIKNFYNNPNAYEVSIDSTLIAEIRGYTTGGTIKNVKLEIGNKPTTWTPAPEDVQNGINNLESRIIKNEASITLLSDSIEENVASIDDLGTRTSTLEQTSGSLTTRITDVENEVNNIEIGGRNLLANSDVLYERTNEASNIQTASRSVVSGYELQSLINREMTFSYYLHAPGTRDASLETNTTIQNRFGMHGIIKWSDSTGVNSGLCTTYPFDANLNVTKSNSRVSQTMTITPPSGYDTIHSFSFSIQMYAKPGEDNDETWLLGYPKLEVGNKATDWSIAPEDVSNGISSLDTRVTSAESSITQLSNSIASNVTETTNLGTRMSTVEQTAAGLTTRLEAAESNVLDAAKTATNYLNFSTSGLVVGDMTASTLGKNVRISSNTVDIREGTTTLASFGADTIYLGKNSETAVINLCNGSATMRSVDDYDFKIYTDKRLVMSAYSSTLLDCWRDSTHMTRISLQSADPDNTAIWGGISCTIYQDTVKNTFDMSNNTTEFKIIKGSTEATVDLNETRLRVQANNTQINCTNGLYVGYDGDYAAKITLGYDSLQDKSIRWFWSDNALHDGISNNNGQATYIGPGDIGETTTTYIRGKYVRLYGHNGGGVYLGSSGSTAVTSDRNMKTDILDIDDKYMEFFDRLRPITYKYDTPEHKGHRDHVGFIAQEVEEALIASGLTTEQFAGLVIEQDVDLNPNWDSSLSGDENKANESYYDTLYSLRYEEFISLLVKKVQSLQEQIDQLRTDS